MDQSREAPGFFGKLRSNGDFVARRMPPAVRDCFDQWLQAALVQSRIALGEAWLATWLSSPLWRFVAAPGVCGEQAWAGVMMPSHDRVGRCFPLLLAAPVDGMPSLQDCLSVHSGWFERLEELALSTLEDGFSLEGFDNALTGLTAALSASGSSGTGCVPAPPAGAAEVTTLSAGLLPALANRATAGTSAWWTDGSSQVAPSLALCSGLPSPTSFASLLDGRWPQRGWSIASAA